ncbi:hypothetical protein [Microvirga sp. TS319]|uniref:hypothetical protein n=1 Tax=Microvirga sp. TS319 TaxID=3241165 RepID=UPI00351AA6D5
MATIEIDLDWDGPAQQGAGGGSGPVGGTIRQEALSQVIRKLSVKPDGEAERDNLQRRRPLALDVISHRRHDAILVSARRGDGKTTFLTEVLRLLEAGRSAYLPYMPEGTTEDKVASLYSLGIVDPTLIETKQNIVIIVIEKIKVAVDRAYRFEGEGKKGEYEDFKRTLHDLAAGLTLLDGIGDSALYGKDWADADYVLERGLDKARSAGEFERAFHLYVEKARKFIGTDAFVLAIDDVDTSFDRGWPVLEALRKYFATPRLKLLLAGDLRLYTLLVRQQQWKQITREFFEVEQKVTEPSSYADQLVGMVDLLQDQYLVKIVRPENRVALPPLLHYAKSPGIAFRSSRANPDILITQEQLRRRYANDLLGIQAAGDRDLIWNTLLRLPLRSGLQAIAGAWDLSRDDRAPQGDKLGKAAQRRARDALGHVASAGMMSLDLAEYDLDDPNPSHVLGALSQWMTDKGLWLTISRFHPGGVDDTKDLVSIRIAARLVELFRDNFHATIGYWLRICVIREKLDRGEIAPARLKSLGRRSEKEDEPDLRVLMEHLNAASTERTTEFVSRLAAWDAGRGRQINRTIRLSGASVPGVSRLREADVVALDLYGIPGGDFKRDVFRSVVANGDETKRADLLAALPPPLRGYHEALIKADWSYSSKRGREAGFIATFANTLDTLRAGLDGDAQAAAMMPALRPVSGQGAENGVYSILRLIAAVAELLEDGSTADSSDRVSRIRGLIMTLSELRSYPTPGVWSEAGTVEDENEAGQPSDDISDDGAEGPDEVSALADVLSHWIEAIKRDGHPITLAPLTLARAWTRFTYAFDGIVSRLTHTRTRYLGVLMHRSIVAFLHAVGVEALRAAGYALRAKVIDNPIESSIPFLQLLNEIDGTTTESNDPNLRFFQVIFSCPLWGYFLARTEADIVGKVDRENATAEVFSRYMKAVAAAIGREPQYEVKFSHNGKEATFDGLYFVLNSLQLQGLPRSKKKQLVGAGVELDKTLRRLGTELGLKTMPEAQEASTSAATNKGRSEQHRSSRDGSDL